MLTIHPIHSQRAILDEWMDNDNKDGCYAWVHVHCQRNVDSSTSVVRWSESYSAYDAWWTVSLWSLFDNDQRYWGA